MNNSPAGNDYLRLHFIIAIFGFTIILGQLTQTSSLGVVLWRTVLAISGIFVIALIKRTRLLISWKVALPVMGIGAVLALHWVCFFGSAKVSNISVSLVCLSTTSFFTSFLEPLMLKKKKFSGIEVFLGLFVVIGMYFVFRFEGHYSLGITIGLIGAVLASLFGILNARIASRHTPLLNMFYQMSGALVGSILFIPFFLIFSRQPLSIMPTGLDWLWLTILALGCTVYPYLELVLLFRKFSAYFVSLSVNMEPVYGIILAYLVFGDKERMTTGFYIGGLLILTSVVFFPVLQRLKNRKKVEVS